MQKELKIDATIDNLSNVIDFVGEQLDTVECPMKTRMQIDVAVEEIFVNIANYAYGMEKGSASICVNVDDSLASVSITFVDSGSEFNPLEKEDPDITLSAEERQIGGLGIFMVKKSMDNVEYEYKEGKNIFTITKSFK